MFCFKVTCCSVTDTDRACSRDLISTFIWKLKKKRGISETFDFFIQLMEQKRFLFDHIIDIRDELTWPGPARFGLVRSGYDALWQVFSQSIQMIQPWFFSTILLSVLNSRIKRWTINLNWIWNYLISRKTSLSFIFFICFIRIT